MTIAILSWGSDKTLENTLASYYNKELERFDDERIILLQEGTSYQEHMSRSFGFRPISLPVNVGIARGYSLLVEQAKGDFFLFLENDWELIEDPVIQLNGAEFLLKTYQADIVRLRHREEPGNPLWTRQFQGNEYIRPTHLLDCVHWESTPERFKEITKKNLTHIVIPPLNLMDNDIPTATNTKEVSWYFASSRNANWTNNPHMARVSFLKSTILPRLIGGNLEADIQGWWEQQDFTVAQSDGLFTHKRLD